jgi:predicted acetyltransferase
MTTVPSASGFAIRDLTTDDLDAAFDVRSRSFGVLEPSQRDWWDGVQLESINGHRALGAFDGERLLAHAKVRSYQQFWGGRLMPMGGVAGVVVAPDARGRGVGTRLVTALAQRSLELGDLVSVLYPATIPVYRTLGWEVAGAQYRISMSAEALRTLGGKGAPLRIATGSDVTPFRTSLSDRYAAQRANGPRLPSQSEAREQFTGDGVMSYVADGVMSQVADGVMSQVADGGLVAYEWAEQDLVVSHISADTPEVARALWATVGSGSSVVKKVMAYVAPDDPIHLLLPEEVAHQAYLRRWMLRVVDVRKAVAARGFSPCVTGSAAVVLKDGLLPGNSGSWRLEVSAGLGVLTPAEKTGASLTLGPNGFAALYAGAPVHVLRAAGLASGGEPAADDLLDAAFAGRAAYLLEYF